MCSKMQKSAGSSEPMSLLPVTRWDTFLPLPAPFVFHPTPDATAARRATGLSPLPNSGTSPLCQHRKSTMRSILAEEAPSQLSPTVPAVAPSPGSPQGWAGIKVPRTYNSPFRCDEDKFNRRTQWLLPLTAGLG